MRVILINFSGVDVARRIVQKGVEILYWTEKKQYFKNIEQEKNLFPLTIFHSVYDAFKAVPAAETKDLRLDFPPGEVFDFLSKIEYQALGMISRADYNGIGYDEKKELFHEYVVYWYGILKYLKPDCIIFSDVPHAGYSYVVYTLARFFGIKTIIHRNVKGFLGRLLLFGDFKNYDLLRAAYGQALVKTVKYDELDEDIKRYLEQQKDIGIKTALTHGAHIEKMIKQGNKIPRSLLNWNSIVKNLKQRTFLSAMYKYFFMLSHKGQVLTVNGRKYTGFGLWFLYSKWKLAKAKYRKEYESLQTRFVPEKKYIYFPLHLQPEGNTNPLGDIFDDQILLVRTLSESIPPDWIIFVKENPMQWLHYQGNFGRYEGYYKKLCSISNVHLVPADTSTFDLINHAQVVATISGTAGVEALIRLKPVLLFGYSWYMDCRGVLKVNDVVSCRRALDVIRRGYAPKENEIIAFLYALGKISIPGFFHKKHRQFCSIKEEDNINNIANALYNNLQNL